MGGSTCTIYVQFLTLLAHFALAVVTLDRVSETVGSAGVAGSFALLLTDILRVN